MLKEYEKYETIGGKKVHTYEKIEFNKMSYQYWYEILKILWETNKWHEYEQQEEILKKESVLSGLTDDLLMPSWYRHVKTGKCLWGNGPSLRGKQRENYLANYDIKIQE